MMRYKTSATLLGTVLQYPHCTRNFHFWFYQKSSRPNSVGEAIFSPRRACLDLFTKQMVAIMPNIAFWGTKRSVLSSFGETIPSPGEEISSPH